MAKEVLSIPEQHLKDVIKVIRMGLKYTDDIDEDVALYLEEWCEDEESYIEENL